MEKAKTSLTLDKGLREDAQKVFDELGLSFSSAIDIFLRVVVREQGIPFPMTARPMKEGFAYSTVSLDESAPSEGVGEDG